ncbi:glycosyltransferase family 39 protein [Calditrichota bacterium]
MKLSKSEFTISKEWLLILTLAATKLLIHLFTFSNFELHRDAYLYYAQSEHLAWGFVSVPPFTAVIAKIATTIFGNTTFGLRFFPALIGAINVVIIGLMVKELGGKKIAIALASLAYIISPSYLHVNFLLQPTSFNHFFWLLCGYLILMLVKRKDPKIWIWIGIAFGIGFLNKYSIIFFCAAFAISLLISQHRSLYKSKYFVYSLILGFIIILPNLLWQYQNNWPVMMHMAELRETQLVHVKISDFIIDQFLMNGQSLLLWIGALLVLLFYKNEQQYRLFGLIYFIVIVLLMLGSGKSYYTLGVYPILFVFGAYFFEKYVKKYQKIVLSLLVISMFFYLYKSLSFGGIPFNTFEQAVKEKAYRWEGGDYHDIPQDMADMTGWSEIGQKVSEIYLSLGPENKDNCDIFCYHYGQAGAVLFYGKQNNIPQPISFNGSFVFWDPDSLSKDYMIWVHTDYHSDFKPDSTLLQRFEKVELKATINNKYFRENPTRIYLCSFPNEYYKRYYKSLANEIKDEYR